ncbi:glycosyltransferase family 1 protein [Pseudoroseomonas cervicalis]|uniref:glycosyltransferase family 4 protein n=1 Tax=Teichococcus cervicalis TaxID=204525 RepID=UPI0022F1731A|nr:glycosyltransferase [Pseudoroseomonas cervicalis]WBV41693.1 glycosyltransferase [Pseudoroseomonas cervicalis]
MSLDLDPAPSEADALLAAADQRRDAAAWSEAAELYGRVVLLRPDAWPLMVQQGHCLKEAGYLSEALARYQDAERLAPEDADLQLQLGHAHKLLGQRREAAEHYARAVTLDPGNADAWREASATASWLEGPAETRIAPVPAFDAPAEARPEAAAEAPPPAVAEAPPEPAPSPAPPPPAAPQPDAQPLPEAAAEAEAPLHYHDPFAHDPFAVPLAPAAPSAPALPAAPVPAPPAASATPAASGTTHLFLDVSDVLVYFDRARTPTGIQRVQMGIVRRAMAEAAPPGLRIQLVDYDRSALCWREVPAEGFEALCAQAATGADPAEPGWSAARDALRARIAAGAPIGFPSGAILANLGNSWGLSEYFRALREVQRRHAVRYIPFLHDCVPLIVPEHCQQSMVRDYARWFAAMALHADGVICNSQNTLQDVRRQMAALLPGLDLTGHVVRLDADPRALMAPVPGAGLEALRALRPGESYALFVATLESRKNHLLVFSAWLQMLRQHGPARVPRLVCVGKPGWHAEAAMTLLGNAPELQRHVLLLPQISDQELDALYEGCAFTVYNSHYEGWGLPITESLAHGKVVVTPRHSALTEAGGEAALYFTPQNLPELVTLLERVAFDAGFRQAQEAVVRERGRPRSWSAVKDDVLAAVVALARQPARPPLQQAQLVLGQRYATRRGAAPRPELAQAMADATREGAGWHRMEDWGVWCREGSAALRLPLPPQAAGAPLRLYLELRTPPEALAVTLRATAASAVLAVVELALQPQGDVTYMLDLPALPAGTPLDLELDNGAGIVAEGIAGEAETRIGAGLRGFMLCRLDDHASRLAFLEQQSFLTPAS